MPGLLGVPVPANITFGSTGSMARLHTIEPFIGVSSRRQWMPPSSLAYTPRSVPAYTTSGRRGSCSSARTMQSECMPCRMPVRVQLSPSSALTMTPWPIVPTRMVPGFAMLHLPRHPNRSVFACPRLYSDRPGSARAERTRRSRQLGGARVDLQGDDAVKGGVSVDMSRVIPLLPSDAVALGARPEGNSLSSTPSLAECRSVRRLGSFRRPLLES